MANHHRHFCPACYEFWVCEDSMCDHLDNANLLCDYHVREEQRKEARRDSGV